MNKNTSYKYDAFISYAPENQATARWLAAILKNYWVPFRRRRKIFFDQNIPVDESLHEQVIEALCQSRFLVVCTSSDAVCASRVDEEIRIFRRYHNVDNVLLCRVGEAADNSRPAEISEKHIKNKPEKNNAASILGPTQQRTPDLRGNPVGSKGAVRNTYKKNSLLLLARIMGFSDKPEFTNIIQRKRRQMKHGLLALLTTLVMCLGIYSYWLATPTRMYHSTMRDVLILAQAESQGSHIIPLARIIASTGERAAIERFAGSYDDIYRPLALAVGYAMLDPPVCNAAALQFRRLRFADDASYLFRDAVLIAASICPELDLQIARPQFDDEDARAQGQWALHLARSGWWAEAREVLLNGNIPNNWKLDILIELQRSGDVVSFVEIERALQAWISELDPDELIWDLWGLLEPLAILDFAGELQSPAARAILPIIIDTFIHYNEQQIKLENTWERIQQVAAHAAGAGYIDAAAALLVLAPEPGANEHGSTGWAWRGLTLDRLGRIGEADKAFRSAERFELNVTAETTGRKRWQTMVETFALADRWREAFRAADKPDDQSIRLDLKMRALELWQQHETPRD